MPEKNCCGKDTPEIFKIDEKSCNLGYCLIKKAAKEACKRAPRIKTNRGNLVNCLVNDICKKGRRINCKWECDDKGACAVTNYPLLTQTTICQKNFFRRTQCERSNIILHEAIHHCGLVHTGGTDEIYHLANSAFPECPIRYGICSSK